MITEKIHKLLTSQLFVTDCTKKGLASMRSAKQHGHDGHNAMSSRGHHGL